MFKEKVKTEDFKETNRPKNRFYQFFDIFKHRFLELFKLSMLQIVFNAPLFANIILYYRVVIEGADVGMSMLIHAAVLVVCLPCSFIGMSGTFYCIKKLAYSEGEYASSSFFVGLKEEWKKGLVIGLLAGLSAFLAIGGSYYLYSSLYPVNSWIAGFAVAILQVQLVIVMMVCYYAMGQSVIYSNKLRYTLKNSFIMTLSRFHINLAIIIFFPTPIYVMAFFEIPAFIAIGILALFAGVGHLGWMLNVLAACDKYINKENYPDFYRKGLANIETKEG